MQVEKRIITKPDSVDTGMTDLVTLVKPTHVQAIFFWIRQLVIGQ